MNYAVKTSNLPASQIECSYFSVTKTTKTFPDSSTAIFLTVYFQADNAVPFTPLKVYTANLKGETIKLINVYSIFLLFKYNTLVTSNFSTEIKRTQRHSTIPGGNVGLTILSPTNPSVPKFASIPIYSDALGFRNSFEAQIPGINVSYLH